MISTQIASTMLGNYNISTVWLPGLNEYETMVFDTSATNPYEELAVERNNHKINALISHAELVKEWGNK